jgi:hypothetical protein
MQNMRLLEADDSKEYDIKKSELIRHPITMYFGIWNLWDQKYTSLDKSIECVRFLPFWRLSNVKNFKFYFTAGFQSMANMLIMSIGLMGQDVRTEAHYFAMMSDPLCDNMSKWVLEDRDVFFAKDNAEFHFRLLMVRFD